MTIACDPELRSLSGRPFEDILDGYFPLRESVRQLLQRQGFKAMWITLLQAPIMHIEGLAPEAPVPLHLRKIYSGMIDHMLLLAVSSAPDGAGGTGEMQLSGKGDWFFAEAEEDRDVFPDLIRLGEPAFVRGIGISGFETENEKTGLALTQTDSRERSIQAATARLGWTGGLGFRLGSAEGAICRRSGLDGQFIPFGSVPGAFQDRPEEWPLPLPDFLRPASWLLLDTSQGAFDRETQEVAMRL
ncbi:hypothetical protein FMN50_01155 [Rhodobacterales bacterium]|nr:hypothetical protein FMN50_01155 [Rhodobacterales bacterium]